jgi:hypothetical protein
VQRPFAIDALPVGQYEHALSCVWRTHGARGEQTPFRIEPEVGQVTEQPTESVGISKESWHVLHEDVSRSHCANDIGEPGPTPTLVGDSSPATECREWLAGEPAAHDIDSGSGLAEPPLGSGSNVVMAWHLRPVVSEYGLAVGV